MYVNLLFLTLALIVSTASAQSDISGTGQDTLVFRDSSLMAVHVIEINEKTIRYKTDSASTDINTASFYHVLEVRMLNGERIVAEDQSIYTAPLGLLKAQLEDKSKRLGHLIVSTHPTTLIAFHDTDPESTIFNLGLGYFVTSNISLNAYYYHGIGETRVQNNIERSNYYQNYPTFENGFEINAGFMTSKNRFLDLGLRAGVFFGKLSYFRTDYNTLAYYGEDNNGWLEYNGNYYSYDYQTFEEISTELKTLTYASPFFNVELIARITARFSVSGSFGIQGVPYVYSDEFYNELNWIRRYVDNSGNIIGEEYYAGNSNYSGMRLEPRVFGRISLNYHMPTKK